MSNWQDKTTTETRQAALLELADCQSELSQLSFWQVVKIFRATKRQDSAIKNLLSTYVFDLQAARADLALKSWRADRVKDFL